MMRDWTPLMRMSWWVWILVVGVVLVLGVISSRDSWNRLELARRECKETLMPGRELDRCIMSKWLFRTAGEKRQGDDR